MADPRDPDGPRSTEVEECRGNLNAAAPNVDVGAPSTSDPRREDVEIVRRWAEDERGNCTLAVHVLGVLSLIDSPASLDMCHNGHPFSPGVNSDGDPPNPAWCDICGEVRKRPVGVLSATEVEVLRQAPAEADPAARTQLAVSHEALRAETERLAGVEQAARELPSRDEVRAALSPTISSRHPHVLKAATDAVMALLGVDLMAQLERSVRDAKAPPQRRNKRVHSRAASAADRIVPDRCGPLGDALYVTDTCCGEVARTSMVTDLADNITCPDCRLADNPEPAEEEA